MPHMVASKKSAAEKSSEVNREVKSLRAGELCKSYKSVHLPANYSATVPVQVSQVKGTVLLKPTKSLDQALQIEESLLEVMKLVLQL